MINHTGYCDSTYKLIIKMQRKLQIVYVVFPCVEHIKYYVFYTDPNTVKVVRRLPETDGYYLGCAVKVPLWCPAAVCCLSLVG